MTGTIEKTVEEGKRVPPKGFVRLDAGPIRKIKVDRHSFDDQYPKPFIIFDSDGTSATYEKVYIEGPSEMVFGKVDFNDGCGKVRAAYIETTASILVG